MKLSYFFISLKAIKYINYETYHYLQRRYLEPTRPF